MDVHPFTHGFTAPWRSLKLLWARSDLWPLVLAPAAIMGVLLVVAIGTALYSARPAALWWLPWLVRWPVLFSVVRAALVVVFCVVFGALASMFGAVLAIPFNDHLSQRVESSQYELPSPLTVREALPMSLLHSMLGAGLWLLLQVVILPLQLLPGIGSLLDLIAGTLLTAFFMSHQMIDGPMSRWNFSFREKLELLWENLPLVLGLGLAAMLMLAIPVLNLFGLPICVGAGALLYTEINPLAEGLRREQRERESSAR